MSLQVATAIQSQISKNTFMCVGASNLVAIPESDSTLGGLRLRTRIDNQRRYIEVNLNGRDLYDVTQVLVRAGKRKVVFEANDVYCDVLDEVVYQIGSTRCAGKSRLQELEQYGIKKV
jgi:hypothetical protein